MPRAVQRRQHHHGTSWRAPACALGALGVLLSAAQAAPAPGRYEGRLCVATTPTAPACGPASVDWRGRGRANVRVSDLLYSLTLGDRQAAVVLTHGAIQIDAFTAPYEWKGTALHFTDTDKRVRYEVHFVERQRAP